MKGIFKSPEEYNDALRELENELYNLICIIMKKFIAIFLLSLTIGSFAQNSKKVVEFTFPVLTKIVGDNDKRIFPSKGALFVLVFDFSSDSAIRVTLLDRSKSASKIIWKSIMPIKELTLDIGFEYIKDGKKNMFLYLVDSDDYSFEFGTIDAKTDNAIQLYSFDIDGDYMEDIKDKIIMMQGYE